jgi:Spy/CpxP family protein refolding chaperone
MRVPQRIAALFVAGAMAITMSAAALAAPGAKGAKGGKRGGAVSPALMSRLNLNEEQKAKLAQAEATFKAETDKAKGLTGADKKQATKQARETYEAAVRATLTTEQQQQLKTMMAEAAEYKGLGPVGNQLVGLNLTAEQKTKIKDIGAKYGPQLQTLREQQKSATDKKALRSQMQDLQQKIMTEVKAVLTPEQQQKLQPVARKKKKNA